MPFICSCQCEVASHIVPFLSGRPAVQLLAASSNGASNTNGASNGAATKDTTNGHAKELPSLRIGIVLSGGQAPGTLTLPTPSVSGLDPYVGWCSLWDVHMQAGIISSEAC